MIRYKNSPTGSYTEVTLHPAPTSVNYPETRLFKTRTTRDGNVIVQRPLRDDRPRRWQWANYRSHMPAYKALWSLLETLEYRHRVREGLHPIVEIWEDETGTGGFGKMEGSNKKWTKVKIVQVHRSVRPGGGHGVVYDDSFMEFYIVDPEYAEF